MAIINCDECGASISSKAVACPGCGNPMSSAEPTPAMAATPPAAEPRKKRTAKKMFAWTALGFAALIVFIAYQGSESKSRSPAAGPAVDSVSAAERPRAPATPPKPRDVSAKDLYAAYKANEVAADNEFKGSALAVSGTVGTIGKDIMDDPYVTLYSDNQYETVNAYFSKAGAPELAKLKKGDSVTVTCKGNGMVLTSPVLDCKN